MGGYRSQIYCRFFLRVLLPAAILAAAAGEIRAESVVDLNTAGVEELQRLPGIGPALARRIVADREANGPFRGPEEVTRVFGIGDFRYQEIKSLIIAGRTAAPLTGPGVGERIPLNTATQAELETLPGIGPVLARRIIDYREREGGFRRVDDLLAVRGIGPKTFNCLKGRVTVYAVALEEAIAPAPPPSGLRDLKCWRCGYTFSAEVSAASGNCPSCGAPWRTR